MPLHETLYIPLSAQAPGVWGIHPPTEPGVARFCKSCAKLLCQGLGDPSLNSVPVSPNSGSGVIPQTCSRYSIACRMYPSASIALR